MLANLGDGAPNFCDDCWSPFGSFTLASGLALSPGLLLGPLLELSVSAVSAEDLVVSHSRSTLR